MRLLIFAAALALSSAGSGSAAVDTFVNTHASGIGSGKSPTLEAHGRPCQGAGGKVVKCPSPASAHPHPKIADRRVAGH